MRILLVSLCILAGPAPGGETPPRFIQKPTTTCAGEEVWVEFAASRETDVAVSILDAQGKAVRHLAAGVLGRKAPAPLKTGSLQQRLSWDGSDDRGRPATGGPFKVRVSLGLSPVLDGFIGYDPNDYNPLAAGAAQSLDSVRALATAPNGELLVFHVLVNPGAMVCSVFSREGRYLRTISPYPASLPEEKLKGFRRVDIDGGVRVPFLYHLETLSLLPGAGAAVPDHRAVATRDGRVAFMSGPRHDKHSPPALQMAVINADGSTGAGAILRTRLAKGKGVVSASLALSPDEKTIYASDVSDVTKGGPVNVVYKFGWEDAEPKPLVSAGLNNPKGLAVDADGNLYVADKGNNRIAIFRPDGALLGEMMTDRPERVEVHPRTGAVYVLGGANLNELRKYSSRHETQPAAKAMIPFFKHKDYTAVLALDVSAEPPVLWISNWKPIYSKFTLLRIEDLGAAFGEQVDIARLPAKAPALRSIDVSSLSFSRPAGLLNIGSRFYEPKHGKFVEPPDAAVARLLRSSPGNSSIAGSYGLDGNYYFQLAHATMRLGPDLKILPFPKGECDAATYGAEVKRYYGVYDKYRGIGGLGGSARCRERGATADLQGNVYILSEKGWSGQVPGPDHTALSVYHPDGSPKKLKLIDTSLRSVTSVRVDPRGNLYLAMALRPGKSPLPPGLAGKLPEGRKDPDATWDINFYPLLYGSVVKFGPEGGLVQQRCRGVECNYGFGNTIEIKGAQWIYPGITSTLGFRTPGAPGSCNCDSPRFDVDSYGRVFFPDAGRFRVWVLDTDGNEICWFGSYGNVDSGGTGGRIPQPPIPLCWPQAVAVDDAGTAYVGDRLNRRVVKVKLGYAAEEVCEIP